MQRPGTYEDVLAGEARAGDAAAFVSLFDQYHGPITGYLFRLTGDRDAADDLAQETFLQAFRAMDRIDPNANFRAWLYRIATNSARSWQRRRRLLTWLPFGADTPEPSGDPALADVLGERELVDAALRRIGPAHASVLLLRHHQQLSLDETAAALGVSPNTAKVRLFRARKAFVAAYTALDAGHREVRG
jgi:RNA polymerase sigma-70 factor (ECF subfamily)